MSGGARTVAQLREKVRIEIWRHELHNLNRDKQHKGLSGKITAAWFINWPKFPKPSKRRI